MKKDKRVLLFLYIKNINANIKFVIIAAILTYIILIFPLFLNLQIYYSANLKRVYFAIDLFGMLKIISGYIEIIKEGVCIHLTKNKAIIIENKQLLGVGEKVKPLKDYHIIRVHSLTEIGLAKNNLAAFSAAFILNYINQTLDWYFYHDKPYLVLDNKINYHEDENVLNLYMKSTIIFNLLMILLSIIKIIMEKIIYAIIYRQQQN